MITRQNHLNNLVDSSTLNFKQEDGTKVWKVVNKLSHNVEFQSQIVWKDMVNLNSELINPFGQNPYCIDLTEISSLDELLKKVRKYAETQTTLGSITIDKRIKKILLMADKDQAFPIDFLNPSVEQYNHHMSWYGEKEYDDTTDKNWFGLREK
jgi:hypothetical protein